MCSGRVSGNVLTGLSRDERATLAIRRQRIVLVFTNTKHDDQWVRKREGMEWTYSNA